MKSLNKALDVIEIVGEKGSVGVREISSLTGFPPATSHRLLSTLAKRGYLVQDKVAKNYSLALRFLELGSKAQQQSDLHAVARPHLHQLMLDSGETANLVVQDGDSVVYLDQVQSDESMLKIFTKLGARAPLYSTGVGKMFLSRWSQPELDSYIERTDLVPHTAFTLSSREEILEEMQRISLQGFAVDNEETELGVRCVAALIVDHREEVIAAVSISGVAMRITEDRIEAFGEMVKECAKNISQDLGFQSASFN
jgi:DNA-binding IclR family transcriptional regulator